MNFHADVDRLSLTEEPAQQRPFIAAAAWRRLRPVVTAKVGVVSFLTFGVAVVATATLVALQIQ